MKKFFLKLNQKLKPLIVGKNSGKELFYEKHYARIGVNTNNDVPLNKQLNFPTLITIIRCSFEKREELDPLIYLDECLYESV